MRTRTVGSLVVAGMASAALAARGPGRPYCDAIDESLSHFENLGSPSDLDRDAAQAAADGFQEIAEAAPENIRPSWQALADTMQVMADAEGDLSQVDPSQLDQQGVTEAQSAIPQSTEDECGLDISGS